MTVGPVVSILSNKATDLANFIILFKYLFSSITHKSTDHYMQTKIVLNIQCQLKAYTLTTAVLNMCVNKTKLKAVDAFKISNESRTQVPVPFTNT